MALGIKMVALRVKITELKENITVKMIRRTMNVKITVQKVIKAAQAVNIATKKV